MLGFVCDVASEVSAYNAMPGWVVLFVKLFFDKRSNVLLDVILLEGLSGTVDSILLHVFGHVGIFDNCFPITHLQRRNEIINQHSAINPSRPGRLS